jgi:aminoglycoside phosphotransferase (APT) family kinase protein
MKTDWSDQPGDVRPGEALDVARLEPYLHKQLPDLNGPLTVRQFPSGFSNLTYLIQVGTEEFVLRRPPFGVNIKTAHDMGREYTILSHLRRVYPKAPQTLFYCDDETILGTPFYVMERVRGIILRTVIPEAMVPPPALMSRIADSFIDNLVELHAVDYQAAGLGNLGRPAGYVQRQIEGWARRYQQARTDDLPELERVSAWLAEQPPSEAGAALIHNDYKYNNLILDVNDWSRILAVLDWEMATLGDPLMDVGAMLGYWIEPGDPPLMQTLRFSPTMLPGNPSREALVERYIRQSGRDIPNLVFYYVYGLFKLAVIIQQIYRRYKLGLTQDARFAHLDQEVRLCGQIAVQAIEKKRVDRLFE